MAYAITHNIIDEEEPKKVPADMAKRLPVKFRLFDDDGNLYFKGIMSDSSSFVPLDTIGAAYGCTEQRVFEDGKWQIL